MKLGIINSAWLGTDVTTEEGIRYTKDIGFDVIDIQADPTWVGPVEKKLIRETCREVGLNIVSLTCVAPGLIDLAPSLRQMHVEWVKEHLNYAYDLGCENLLLVLGEYIWQQEVIAPEDQWKWAVENLQILGGYAEKLGLQIAIELEPFEMSLINTVQKMNKFLDDVGHPAVQANADVSHLHLVDAPTSRLQELKDKIIHVHFSDTWGDVHQDLVPGTANADLEGYLKELKKMGYEGTISIELEFCPEPDRIVSWVKEAYTYTADLMDKLNIRD